MKKFKRKILIGIFSANFCLLSLFCAQQRIFCKNIVEEQIKHEIAVNKRGGNLKDFVGIKYLEGKILVDKEEWKSYSFEEINDSEDWAKFRVKGNNGKVYTLLYPYIAGWYTSAQYRAIEKEIKKEGGVKAKIYYTPLSDKKVRLNVFLARKYGDGEYFGEKVRSLLQKYKTSNVVIDYADGLIEKMETIIDPNVDPDFF